MKESGFSEFVVDTWLGFCGPAGLPPAIVTRLNAEFNRITELPEMRKKFLEQGMSAWPARTPEQALQYVRQDTTFWLPVIKQSGATAG
jgi:tripartite-type tricarboxylate transporter receptor subunit TctC